MIPFNKPFIVGRELEYIAQAVATGMTSGNRAEYLRGEVSKYQWVDVGSSFLPSGITAAFLWAQLEELRLIQDKRLMLWDGYHEGLKPLADKGCFTIPQIPPYATNNAHMFYMVCRSQEERGLLMEDLMANGIQTATHYQSLHDSVYYRDKHTGPELVNCKRYVNCLVRLPLFYELELTQVQFIVSKVNGFYNKRR